MLDEFGIIDMPVPNNEVASGNGRIYCLSRTCFGNPVIARFFSPDPFVQAPGFSQSYNRYSYVTNNPLVYTDPSGEWIWMIPMAVGFATGYISHGATTGDWGWSAVGAGAIGAAVSTFGFYSGGATSAASIAGGFQIADLGGHAATVALGYSGRYVASAAISSIMPSMTIPVGDNFSVNVSPGVGFGSSGWAGGVNVSGTYADGKTVISGGVGISGNSVSWGGSATYDGIGASYYQTQYGSAVGPDGNSNYQTVAGVGLHFRDVSFRLENDFLAFKNQDRWRSNAFELSIGNFVIGNYIYNNDPKNTYGADDYNMDGESPIYGKNQGAWGAWNRGYTYSAPLYIGYRIGGTVHRAGYSHHSFQDATQNGVHKYFPPGRQHYYQDYSRFNYGLYNYNGWHNQYSIWGK
jgi:RHS repeat-associated protein